MKNYYNQNHAIHRKGNGFDKIASIYDQQGVSNRVQEEKELSFSSLTPSESESIIGTMKKEAAELDNLSLEKKAGVIGSPFEVFGHAKAYIASKLGINSETSHDLAQSVVARAQDLQQLHGGDIETMITGIVDQMNPQEVQDRVGAVPMRPFSPNELEEHIKQRLIEELQMTAFQADQFKKIIVQQAKNLLVQYRAYKQQQIADAIINVLVQHQDASIAYGISTSGLLKQEIEHQLTQV